MRCQLHCPGPGQICQGMRITPPKIISPKSCIGHRHQTTLQRITLDFRAQRTCRVKAEHSHANEDSGRNSNQNQASSLLQALQQVPQIGSEYGEGFIQYRMTGESTHLDVDTLNEKLQLKGAERMRTSMRPDEAFGMIFSFDGVIADMQQLQLLAWQKLAVKHGFWRPKLRPQIFKVQPERAITEVLHWTRDWKQAQNLSRELAYIVAEDFKALNEPLPGVLEWLLALKSVQVPCALATNIERTALNDCLERMGLKSFFSAIISAEDGMDTTSQRFLSSAIKLGRPPRDCVVFESNPIGITAAHNCSCKVVAVQGLHPGYRLQQADLTCRQLSELSIYNIRRLFANRGSDFMDKKKMYIPNFGSNKRNWRVANGTIDP